MYDLSITVEHEQISVHRANVMSHLRLLATMQHFSNITSASGASLPKSDYSRL